MRSGAARERCFAAVGSSADELIGEDSGSGAATASFKFAGKSSAAGSGSSKREEASAIHTEDNNNSGGGVEPQGLKASTKFAQSLFHSVNVPVATFGREDGDQPSSIPMSMGDDTHSVWP